MVILRGFPRSNTIHEGIRLPDIVETPVKVGELKLKDKFRTEVGTEFMFIEKNLHGGIAAVCYKSDHNHELGGIYGMSLDKEVIWFREDWTWERNKNTTGSNLDPFVNTD